ncbi:hypothetical protein M9Y10_029891 [Tritrichomonas musculus]|uniref:Uncharacterized protein n=1 Tax=Tritrichomonas musculus TaxID=1915356 RepID=A0ABR2KQG0_9EUKA
MSTEAKLLISDDEDEPILKVSDSVFVSPESSSALRNLELNGTLHIYPDSTLYNLHLLKAYLPIDKTDDGIDTYRRKKHPSNE